MMTESFRACAGQVQVGAQTKGSRADGSVYTTVVEQAPHPEYNEVSEENDFMILKLGGWVSL
jgi:hypothetical protein